jgi:hypothetical protein
LRDLGYPVQFIHHLGNPCEDKPNLRQLNPPLRFANIKAQYYQNVADAFERDEVEGLMDDTTIGQLAGILYEINSHGQQLIEPKKKAAERGVPSPDRAEALMLAFGPWPRAYEYRSSRDLDQPRRQGGELPPTEDDMPDFIRGAGGRFGFKKGAC